MVSLENDFLTKHMILSIHVCQNVSFFKILSYQFFSVNKKVLMALSMMILIKEKNQLKILQNNLRNQKFSLFQIFQNENKFQMYSLKLPFLLFDQS